MHLLTITAALCLAYVVMLLLFPMFFRQPIGSFQLRSLASLVVVGILSLLTAVVSGHIPDAALGNRFLHTVGGGLLGTLAAFLAARDSRISTTRFQFVVFSSLVVNALGVGNELVEFVVQSTTNRVFADTIDDTWFDLACNVAGILIGQVVLLPFHRRGAPARPV